MQDCSEPLLPGRPTLQPQAPPGRPPVPRGPQAPLPSLPSSVSPVRHVAALTQCGRTSQDRPRTSCPSSRLVSGKACYTRSQEPDMGWGLLRVCCPFCILTSLRSAPSSRLRCWPGPGLPSPPQQAPRPHHACQHQPPKGLPKGKSDSALVPLAPVQASPHPDLVPWREGLGTLPGA